MIHILQEHIEKHIAALFLLSQSKTWQLITTSSLLSSGNKLAALVQGESVKEHGRENKPGAATALIGDITRSHVEASLSQVEGGSVQGTGLPKESQELILIMEIKGLTLRIRMRMSIRMRMRMRMKMRIMRIRMRIAMRTGMRILSKRKKIRWLRKWMLSCLMMEVISLRIR